jgi:predicted house-cleaning NTP pyrophosphatase (Maf/HAM1 superfamily)
MFEGMMGHTIVAVTGVCLISLHKDITIDFEDRSSLIIKHLTRAERDDVFRRFNPCLSSGGFSLSDTPEIYENIQGSTTNIEGLPLEKTTLEIQRLSIA